MTDESIVSVEAHTFRFCGVVAKAAIRTIQLNPYNWDSESYNSVVARKVLSGSPKLMKYWMLIFSSYALIGTNALIPFQPATKFELLVFEQIARAMEIFAIAHEYGHAGFTLQVRHRVERRKPRLVF
jgi:hypothetical protein